MSIFDGWTQERLGREARPGRRELNAYSLAQFNLLLKYAKTHGGFYKDYPEQIFSLDQVQELPTICAQDIGSHGRQMVCVSQSEIDRVLTVESSGTTGPAKRLFFTKEDMESTVDFYARGFPQFLRPGQVVLDIFPCEREHSVGRLVGNAIERMGARPILAGPAQSFEALCQIIEAQEVSAAAGLPVMLLSLARYGLARGRKIHLESLLVSGDYLSEYVRAELEDIWGCKVYNHYGLAESGLGLALECDRHVGMHLREADIYVEILGDDGKSLPDGTWGELTLTTLTRRGMPLIRYRTGDRARILPEPCACGSFLKRIDRIAGRIKALEDPLWIHTLDEQIFALSRDIIDYSAWTGEGGQSFHILSDAPPERLKEQVQCVAPDAQVTVGPIQDGRPLYLGKRSLFKR